MQAKEIKSPRRLAYRELAVPGHSPGSRFEAFRELFTRNVIEVEMKSPNQGAFDVTGSGLSFSGMVLNRVRASAITHIRTERLARIGPERVRLIRPLQGCYRFSIRDDRFSLSPGQVLLLPVRNPYEMVSVAEHANQSITIELDLLRPYLPRGTHLLPQIKTDRAVMALLDAYVASMLSTDAPLDLTALRTLELHLIDLVALLCDPTRDAKVAIESRGLREAARAAVLDGISRNCTLAHFNAEQLAGQLGISSRYVRKVLEGTGRTFSQHVLEERLMRARALLANPRLAKRKIGEIASMCGFSEISQFNRSIRRRFGDTPSGLRVLRNKD